jgi:hypothetical protein
LLTLKEAWVSDLKGLRNQASFSLDLVGKCPNFAIVATMQMLRALSHDNLFVLTFFISRIVFTCFFDDMMTTYSKAFTALGLACHRFVITSSFFLFLMRFLSSLFFLDDKMMTV